MRAPCTAKDHAPILPKLLPQLAEDKRMPSEYGQLISHGSFMGSLRLQSSFTPPFAEAAPLLSHLGEIIDALVQRV